MAHTVTAIETKHVGLIIRGVKEVMDYYHHTGNMDALNQLEKDLQEVIHKHATALHHAAKDKESK